VCGYHGKRCDPLVTQGPNLSALEMQHYKALYKFTSLYFTLLYLLVLSETGQLKSPLHHHSTRGTIRAHSGTQSGRCCCDYPSVATTINCYDDDGDHGGHLLSAHRPYVRPTGRRLCNQPADIVIGLGVRSCPVRRIPFSLPTVLHGHKAGGKSCGTGKRRKKKK